MKIDKSSCAMRTLVPILSLLFGACVPTAETQLSAITNPSPSPSPSATFTPAAGARAAKIIFKTGSSGSFDALPSGYAGATAQPGGGYQAVRIFNADSSLLASSTSSWPKWLTKVEIGIPSTAIKCANFAASETQKCKNDLPCGVSDGIFRVSEYDCSGVSTGNGGPSDTVYIRSYLSRDPANIAPYENLLAVLEYGSYGVSAHPADPTRCYVGGVFNPSTEGCADMVWQIFMKHNAYELVQPFLMLTPPVHAMYNGNTGGSGISTKQFVIPLAGDANLNVVQLSRITALAKNYIEANCIDNPLAPPGGSALCVGMVFYSLTFFRI